MYLVETAAQYTNIYFQKNLVGVIILREKVEKDIALNTAAIFPPWRRLKQHYSQWYLFHEPLRWLLPCFELPFHYAASESNLSRNRLLQQDLEASARVAAHIAISLRSIK